jgi:Tfp pilus assembly protein PilN
MPLLSGWRCGEKKMEIKLNLIPPKYKEEIAKNNRKLAVINAEITATFILLCFLGMLISVRYILKLNLNSLSMAREKSAMLSKYNEIKDYDSQFVKVNSNMGDVLLINKDQLYWSNLFVKLSGIVFPGIEIETLATMDYDIIISGIAKNRDDLILFKEKLAKEECFTQVDLPLSELADKENVEFKISFRVNEDCLKNK